MSRTPFVSAHALRRARAAFFTAALSTAPLHAADVGGSSGVTELGSTDAAGQFLTVQSSNPDLSEDGRYMTFSTSQALVPGDANNETDVYVIDRTTGDLTCASQTQAGIFGNDESFGSRISGDGSAVVFMTDATNFLPLDGNGKLDVYHKDLQTGVLTRVSNAHLSPATASGESVNPSISDDGRFIAFRSTASDVVAFDTNGFSDVFWHDIQTGLTQRVSNGFFGEPNGASGGAAISGDGTHVAFTSSADNLVIGDTNGKQDVFVVEPGFFPTLVSRTPAGAPGNGHSNAPDISYDGSRIAFASGSSDLVNWDINGFQDSFCFDLDTLTMERVSLSSLQLQQGNNALNPRISRDGKVVAFTSLAPFAPVDVPSYQNVFLRNLDSDQTWWVSRPSGTTTGSSGHSSAPSLAQGGSILAFQSTSSGLVPGDLNGVGDIFIRTVHPDPYAYCAGSTTFSGCQPLLKSSGHPSVSSGEFFTLEGDELPNAKLGLLFYGFGGQASIPFAGATLCVAPPLARSTLIPTGGNPAVVDDCSGFFAFDMNGFADGLYGGQPRPELSIVGQRVNIQYWGRDPLGASGTFLTGAIEYVVGP